MEVSKKADNNESSFRAVLEETPKDKEIDDSAWNSLVDQKNINRARAKAEKEYEHLTSDEVIFLRQRAKTDKFFLGYGVLGYTQLTQQLHLHFLSWLERNAVADYRLVLEPRGHFKTTCATIIDSIQDGLPNIANVTIYPSYLGPEMRELLCHETLGGASRFLFEITGHFVSNPKLMALFPECIPNARFQRMNKFELDLPRESHHAEPTYDTMGVGGKNQGRHYNKIKLDDIFGDKARDSAAERETCKQWFDNIQSFFTNIREGKFDLIGTRYSLDDVYSHAMEVYGSSLIKYIRRIEEWDEKLQKSIPIFPENFPAEKLVHLKKNRKVWLAQYCNDPREGLADFSQSWKRFYNKIGEHKVQVFDGKSTTTYKIPDLDITILCDPAVTGLPGVIVTGTSPKLQVFVLEAIKKPMKPPEFVDLLFKLVVKYWPRTVSIEHVLFSAIFTDWLTREMQLRNIRFHITPYKPPMRIDKMERVKKLSNYFAAGQIFFHESMTDLITEFDNFGATENYHLLDALSQGPSVWREGLSIQQMNKRKEMENRFVANSDIEVGYSKIYDS